MRPVLFFAFGLPVGSYGFFMTVAHLAGLAFLFALARANRRSMGPLLDAVIAVVIFGLVGARLGYAFNHWNEFSGHAGRLLRLSEGGLSFYGGFAPAFFAFVLVLRWRKLPILETSDLVSPVLPFSLGLMRIGCFLQGCCYGAPTSVPWAVTFTRLDGKVPLALLDLPLHPTQLYESGFLFLLAVALAFAQRGRRLPPGVLATLSVLAYALYRFVADGFRGDLARGFWGLSWMAPTQAAAFLGILSAPLVLWICLRAARRA
jgi:phosphatidylglycerol:prolipoprotein diacylglycerol transferase